MRIITLNVNGIRAAARKGFFAWLDAQHADVVCLQEVRAQDQQLTDPIFHPQGYHCRYLNAERAGYSGVAIYSRRAPTGWVEGLGWPEIDSEARYLEARYPGISVISLYLPSGSSKDARQQVKMEFLERFMPYLRQLRKRRREYVLCGDFNIAHRAIDLKNWRANQKNSGFLPEERAWLDELFDRVGYIDGFRALNPAPDQYTWWSNRGRAWDNNVGWRIDYQVVTPGLGSALSGAEIYKDERFSDHAPLILDYSRDL